MSPDTHEGVTRELAAQDKGSVSEGLDHRLASTSLPYARIASSLMRGDAHTRMIALCAEPGLGRHNVITDVLSIAAQRGLRVVRHGLWGRDPSSAASLMVRVARTVSRAGCGSLVAFDDVPASDEACVRRQARALRRLWEAGVSTIFSLAPEAGALLELLPESVVLTSRDLLVGPVVDSRRNDGSHLVKDLTFGIPSLVGGLVGTEGEVCADRLPSAYLEALCSLVEKALRPNLSDEELRLRLAMILLGRGTRGDLDHVLGGVSDDVLSLLRANVPMVDLSASLDAFRCLRGDSVELIELCRSTLASTCALFPDVLPACARVLVRRGDFARAAALFGVPGADVDPSLVLGHSSEFLGAGQTGLVTGALGSLASLGPEEGSKAGALRSALAAIGTRTPSRASLELPADVVEGATGDERSLMMLVDARRVLRGLPPLVPFDEAGWDEVGRALLVHREVCDLMARGRPSAAMRTLVANPYDVSRPRVTSALLCLDLEAVRLTLCERPVVERSCVDGALAFLRGSTLVGLEGYAACFEALRSMMAGDGGGRASRLEVLVARSERTGDVLVQSAALVIGCVADLRKGTYARAGVRSQLAVAVSRRAGLSQVARVAELLGDVSRFLLGDAPVTAVPERPADDLGAVCALSREAMAAEEDLGPLDDDLPTEVPRDALWLLLVLGDGMGAFSSLLRRAMPTTWQRALLVARPAWRAEGAALEGPQDLPGALAPTREAPSAPIEVTLLGGFSLSVHGTRVLDGRLEHRNAKSMLTYLALQRGGTARRYQLVEQVWPDCDYATGFNRAYQATSTLRAVVAEMDPDLDPFVISRATKAVTLDRSLVSCDVDEFRACAREASDGFDDARVVQMARRAEQLYAGDLYAPAMDATGFVAAAREELRRLYVDAMVAGADAALRLGQKRTATRLALDALSTDELREDAVIVLVRALRASGRNMEADQQYRRYARRLMQTTSRPPSRLLRRAAGREGGDRPGRSLVESVSA